MQSRLASCVTVTWKERAMQRFFRELGHSKLKPKQPHWIAPDRAVQPLSADARSGALVRAKKVLLETDPAPYECRISNLLAVSHP